MSLAHDILCLPGFDPHALADTPETGTCTFEECAAQDAIDFIENCLHFVEGEWNDRPFRLEVWQRAVVANLFGWKRPDGSRRFRKGLFYVPRKNAKSTTAAALTLTAAFTDNEAGAQIYCAAAEKEQAKFVWTAAKRMIEAEPELLGACKIYKALQTIEIPSIGAYIKPLSVDANTKHGSNPHWVTLDELHAQRDRDLDEALTSGMGARRQPMMFYLTTADHYGPSLCNEVYKFACNVRDNDGDPDKPGYDATFLPIIYEAEKGDDWKDEKTWYKANPNLGVSVKLDFMRAECRKAQEVTTYENTFRRLHLNQQTEQSERWIPMDKWTACGDRFKAADLLGKKCWGGLDLANTSDLAALALAFPEGDTMRLLLWFWCPWEQAERRSKRDGVPYLTWERGGFLTRTPGDVIDYSFIRSQIVKIAQQYDLQDIGYDKYNAQHLVNQLTDEDGIHMVEFGQSCIHMNDPCKQFSVLIEQGKLRHGGNPVLNWMAGNVSIVFDANNNFKPDKKRSGDKIDGIVASIMAVARAMNSDTTASVYETRGLLTVGGEDENFEAAAASVETSDFDGEIRQL